MDGILDRFGELKQLQESFLERVREYKRTGNNSLLPDIIEADRIDQELESIIGQLEPKKQPHVPKLNLPTFSAPVTPVVAVSSKSIVQPVVASTPVVAISSEASVQPVVAAAPPMPSRRRRTESFIIPTIDENEPLAVPLTFGQVIKDEITNAVISDEEASTPEEMEIKPAETLLVSGALAAEPESSLEESAFEPASKEFVIDATEVVSTETAAAPHEATVEAAFTIAEPKIEAGKPDDVEPAFQTAEHTTGAAEPANSDLAIDAVEPGAQRIEQTINAAKPAESELPIEAVEATERATSGLTFNSLEASFRKRHVYKPMAQFILNESDILHIDSEVSEVLEESEFNPVGSDANHSLATPLVNPSDPIANHHSSLDNLNLRRSLVFKKQTYWTQIRSQREEWEKCCLIAKDIQSVLNEFGNSKIRVKQFALNRRYLFDLTRNDKSPAASLEPVSVKTDVPSVEAAPVSEEEENASKSMWDSFKAVVGIFPDLAVDQNFSEVEIAANADHAEEYVVAVVDANVNEPTDGDPVSDDLFKVISHRPRRRRDEIVEEPPEETPDEMKKVSLMTFLVSVIRIQRWYKRFAKQRLERLKEDSIPDRRRKRRPNSGNDWMNEIRKSPIQTSDVWDYPN